MNRQSCQTCIHNKVCNITPTYMSSIGNTCLQYQDANLTVAIPWPVGTTLYRVEKKRVPCKFGEIRRETFQCQVYHNCYLNEFQCQCRLNYEVYAMENADIRTIVCNMDKANDTVFDDKNKALARAGELNNEYKKQRKEWVEENTRPQAYDENGNKIDYAVFDTDYVKREPVDGK